MATNKLYNSLQLQIEIIKFALDRLFEQSKRLNRSDSICAGKWTVDISGQEPSSRVPFFAPNLRYL